MGVKYMLCHLCVLKIVICVYATINNVCNSIDDYDNKDLSENCWFNSDAFLDVPQIVTKYGYEQETYKIVTEDGYILQLFRIVKKDKNIEINKKQPVLLIHGFLASSGLFVINGNESFGFILAENNYDVWLANLRGTIYSQRHVKYSKNDLKYWDFSYEEMGKYDMHKIVDQIYETTKRNDIILMGHSMGTNVQLVYAVEHPIHAIERVKLMVYLAPAAFLRNVKTPLVPLIHTWPILEQLSNNINLSELLSKEQFSTEFLLNTCCQSSNQVKNCEYAVFTICGYHYDNMKHEIFPGFLGHFPQGTSIKTLLHLSQNAISGNFTKYNYINKQNYNQTDIQSYNISNIQIPGIIFSASNDFLSTEQAGVALFNNLPTNNNILHIINDKKFNHLDFLFGKNINEQLYKPLLNYLKKYEN